MQSSTLLLMAKEGELELDAAIFADTQWEPAAVYEHLDWLESVTSVPIYRVTAGSIRQRALEGSSDSWMPLHVINLQGGKGLLRRQCTRNYKIRPIARQVRALGGGPKHPVTMVIGISFDELHRMRMADVGYMTNEYPLVERHMSRTDCLVWLGEHGYPRPPKSSCIGCPYRGDAGWRSLTADEFADAVSFDHQIRDVRGHMQSFLHSLLVPLDEADLRSAQERGQMDLFSEDCSGVCGV